MPNLLSKLPLDPASVTPPSPPTADTVIELPAGSHGVDGLTKNPGTTLIRPQPGVSRDEITLHFAGSWNNKNLVIEGCTLSAGQGEWCFGGNTSTELWLIDCEFIGADFPGTGDITNAVLHQGTALYFINSTIRRIRRPCWMSGTTIGGKSFAYNSEFYDCYEDFAQHLKTAKNIYAERIGINVPSGGHPDVFQRSFRTLPLRTPSRTSLSRPSISETEREAPLTMRAALRPTSSFFGVRLIEGHSPMAGHSQIRTRVMTPLIFPRGGGTPSPGMLKEGAAFLPQFRIPPRTVLPALRTLTSTRQAGTRR